MVRLETEFKDVAKKSDLLAETARLERRIREAVDEVRNAGNGKWIANLGTLAAILTLCLAAYIAFFK